MTEVECSLLTRLVAGSSALIIWIAIASGLLASPRKGHSFVGYFIFSLIFFPAALIVAYLVQDRRALA